MPVYELINPSDPYTFVAPSIEVAGACAVSLSSKYGARDLATDEQTPVWFGWPEWLADRGIDNAWAKANAAAIADAFDSFLIGKPSHREDVESMLKLIPEEKREQWRNERQERHRSSLSQIGERAYQLAKQWRKLVPS